MEYSFVHSCVSITRVHNAFSFPLIGHTHRIDHSLRRSFGMTVKCFPTNAPHLIRSFFYEWPATLPATLYKPNIYNIATRSTYRCRTHVAVFAREKFFGFTTFRSELARAERLTARRQLDNLYIVGLAHLVALIRNTQECVSHFLFYSEYSDFVY